MKYVAAEKYNIAWFKLAEYVTRKERERAFCIYRLLVHSLKNSAVAYQLEADLFLSFHEQTQAISSYIKAADYYEQRQSYIDAALIYKQICSLCPNNQSYLKHLINLYKLANNKAKVCFFQEKLTNNLTNSNFSEIS